MLALTPMLDHNEVNEVGPIAQFLGTIVSTRRDLLLATALELAGDGVADAAELRERLLALLDSWIARATLTGDRLLSYELAAVHAALARRRAPLAFCEAVLALVAPRAADDLTARVAS